jgi:hypothetical protein
VGRGKDFRKGRLLGTSGGWIPHNTTEEHGRKIEE